VPTPGPPLVGNLQCVREIGARAVMTWLAGHGSTITDHSRKCSKQAKRRCYGSSGPAPTRQLPPPNTHSETICEHICVIFCPYTCQVQIDYPSDGFTVACGKQNLKPVFSRKQVLSRRSQIFSSKFKSRATGSITED
jgi:hypothetical protein